MISNLLKGKSKESIVKLSSDYNIISFVNLLLENDLKVDDILEQKDILRYLNTLDIYDWYEFVIDYDLDFSYMPIISNLDNFKIKMYNGDKNDGYSVLFYDNNLDFGIWLDVWIEDGEIYSDWNQEQFNLINLKDMITKTIQNGDGVFEYATSLAEEKLITDKKIIETNDGFKFK